MSTIIINGGEPLEQNDIPENFDIAHRITDGWNEKLPFDSVNWSWDCGFKLDFDGGLISLSSRFYPPKKHYGPGWDGTVAIVDGLGDTITEKKFQCATLEQLKEEVEQYVNNCYQKIMTQIKAVKYED